MEQVKKRPLHGGGGRNNAFVQENADQLHQLFPKRGFCEFAVAIFCGVVVVYLVTASYSTAETQRLESLKDRPVKYQYFYQRRGSSEILVV